MDDAAIARWRLSNQLLTAPHAGSASAVLDTLLAVQAENPSQSAWAVASRTSSPNPRDLAALLASGGVVRTHVLRPTWHYAARDDIDWLLALTGPRLFAVVESYPELKANQNFLSLQEELTSTENKIGFSRQAYNDEVMRYNTKLEVFPANMVAGPFQFKPATFFEVANENEREAPKVKF